MADERPDDAPAEVPDGAAVFPLIPEQLGVHPLFLAALHGVVFFHGSAPDVVNEAAADEALEYIAGYLQRLEGNDLRRVREDVACLIAFAKDEKWPKELVRFLHNFLKDHGVGEPAGDRDDEDE